jgi:hypothetical protein
MAAARRSTDWYRNTFHWFRYAVFADAASKPLLQC